MKIFFTSIFIGGLFILVIYLFNKIEPIKPIKKEKTLPLNTVIRVQDFDCFGIIVDSTTKPKKYLLRYQTTTNQIIDQWFKASDLDTIPWINSK